MLLDRGKPPSLIVPPPPRPTAQALSLHPRGIPAGRRAQDGCVIQIARPVFTCPSAISGILASGAGAGCWSRVGCRLPSPRRTVTDGPWKQQHRWSAANQSSRSPARREARIRWPIRAFSSHLSGLGDMLDSVPATTPAGPSAPQNLLETADPAVAPSVRVRSTEMSLERSRFLAAIQILPSWPPTPRGVERRRNSSQNKLIPRRIFYRTHQGSEEQGINNL